MRTTRLSALLPLGALLALPTLAGANCYSVYDAQNRLAFQSTVAPIDLSARISDGMRSRFPGGFFIKVERLRIELGCEIFDVSFRNGSQQWLHKVV